MENCIYCNFEIPHGAKFCPNCINQVVCLSCGKDLNRNVSICIYCGTETKITQNSAKPIMNEVSYSETNGEHKRDFNASFTNETSGNIVETFARFWGISKNTQTIMLPATEKNENDKLYIEEEEKNNSTPANPPSIKSSNAILDGDYIEKLSQIFEVKNEEINLFEREIKANSKRDAVARLVLLFLLYKRLINNENDVPRSEIKELLSKMSIDDANFRAWLSSNRNYLTNNSDVFSLTSGSLKDAKKYVLDVFDDDIPNIWDLKNAKSNGSSKESNSIQKKTKKTKNSSETEPVTDLNLKPTDKQTLKDFFNSFKKISSNYERNLVFIYYLQHELEVNPISINHIHTCYLDLKIKLPNLYQSIIDTKGDKKWIDYEDMSDIKVNRLGRNYIEHDLVKI